MPTATAPAEDVPRSVIDYVERLADPLRKELAIEIVTAWYMDEPWPTGQRGLAPLHAAKVISKLCKLLGAAPEERGERLDTPIHQVRGMLVRPGPQQRSSNIVAFSRRPQR